MYVLCSILLVIPLIIFFVYAIIVDVNFFVLLGLGLVLIIYYLAVVHSRYTRRRSDIELSIQDIAEQKNLIQAENKQEKRVIDAFKKKIVSYDQLKNLTVKLSMCLTLEDTVKAISLEVNRLFGSKDKSIILYLFHSKTGEIGLKVSQKGQMRLNLKLNRCDIFDQWVAKNMQSLLVEDTKNDYRFDADKVIADNGRIISSLISVPLMVGSKALGILRCESPQIKNFDTEDLRFFTTIADIGAIAIENAQLYEHVEQLAIKDSLTNLYLRRYLMERMPIEIQHHQRASKPLSFLMIDLDYFKQYNDKFGHVAGDIVLRKVSSVLEQRFQNSGNLVCRYGGEEFCVLLPNCTKTDARTMAEEVRKQVESQTIILRREKTHVTISVGIASFPRDGLTKEVIIQRADEALYQAKEAGRNCVYVH